LLTLLLFSGAGFLVNGSAAAATLKSQNEDRLCMGANGSLMRLLSKSSTPTGTFQKNELEVRTKSSSCFIFANFEAKHPVCILKITKTYFKK
jgi:hypothetical protein